MASQAPASPAHEALGPLLWKVESTDGQVSYVLASGQDVSSKQLIPEVWQRFDESRELLLEMNVDAYLDWLRAREPTLPDMLGQGAFEDLLIAVPGMPADALARMPTAFVASGLAAPAKHPGATSANAFLLKAEASGKPVQYLVADVAEYVDPFEAVLSDIDELRENMADPSSAIRERRLRRRAYLDGDTKALAPERYDSPQYIALLEQQNRPWIETLDTALAQGGVFAVISESDLLSEHGLLSELGLRGYKVERALVGLPSSLNLPAQQTLHHSECIEVLHHIFGVASPEAADSIQDPDVLRIFELSDQGRALLAGCRAQTTAWFDCVTDSNDLPEMEKCDKKHPLGG